MRALAQADAALLVWWATPVEVASALSRKAREPSTNAAAVAHAEQLAKQLAAEWDEVQPTDAVRRTAERLLRTHPLRAADSLQLAAALIAADHDPATLEFVCLDARLATAARIEGFTVIDG